MPIATPSFPDGGVPAASDSVLANVGGASSNITIPNLVTTLSTAGLGRWTKQSSDYTAAPSNYTLIGGTFTAVAAWAALTVYAATNVRRPTVANGFFYDCKTGGTSGAAEPAWNTTIGGTTTDGTVTWRCRGLCVIDTTSDLSATFKAGTPIKYAFGGTTYYGVVVKSNANRIGIDGPPLRSDQSLTILYYGGAELLVQKVLHKAGVYGGSVATITLDQPQRWQGRKAYFVRAWFIHGTADGTTDPKCNVKIGGNVVLRYDGDLGVQVSTGWTTQPEGYLYTANYGTDWDSAIDVNVTAVAAANLAADLSVMLDFVLE